MCKRVMIRIAGLTLAFGLLLNPFFGHWTGSARAQDTNQPRDHLVWSLPEPKETYSDTAFVPGEILVGFHADRGLAATVMGGLALQDIEELDLRGSDNLHGRRVSVTPGQEWAVIDALTHDPAVAFAVPNWVVHAAYDEVETATEIPFLVDDPLYDSRQWYLQRVQASRAWGLTTGDNAMVPTLATIQVAVIDSGIDATHPEFAGRLLTGKNYIDSDEGPIDDCGHGTHVAGLVGAAVNNGSGIAGAATNVELDPRKVLAATCSGSISDVAQAIRDAADAGADVINLSLEATAPSPVLELAVEYAARKDVLLIASAGNSASAVLWPAAYPEVMAVAATDYDDEQAFYSNFGPQVEIAAPGGGSVEQIYSTWSQEAALECSSGFQVIDGGSYCNAIGTSMSAPVVSGAAALVWGIRPDLSARDVRSILKETATPIDEDYGRVNLHRAIRKVLPNDLLVSESQLEISLPEFTEPFAVGLSLQNPSLDAIEWRIEVDPSLKWLSLPDAPDGAGSGEVKYGEPVHLPLIISPFCNPTPEFGTTLKLTGIKSDASTVVHTVQLKIVVERDRQCLYMPLYLTTDPTPPGETPNFDEMALSVPSGATDFHWEVPDDPEDRIVRGLGDSSRIWVTLPFTFPIRDRRYPNARLYSDGFLSFAEAESIVGTAVTCLPETSWPHDAIYGWWTDLDPSAVGARVSMFPLGTNRFVIEFENVPMVAFSYGDTLSFQMVLYDDGQVDLNYLEVPSSIGRIPFTTIGVEALDGRMHNQIYCADTVQELGSLPKPRQSFVIKTEDIF